MHTILSEEAFVDFKKDLININYFKLLTVYTVIYFISLLMANTFIFKTQLYSIPFTAFTAILCSMIICYISKKSLPREIEKNLKNTLPDNLTNDTYYSFTPSTYIFSKSMSSRGYLLFNETAITYISLKNKFGCKDFPLNIDSETLIYTGNTKTDFITRLVSVRPIVYLIIEQGKKKYHFQVHNPDKVIEHIRSTTMFSQQNNK